MASSGNRFQALSEGSSIMDEKKFTKVSKRPLIILSLVFLVVVVIVGVVTWKLTKDAYESSSPQEIKEPEDNTGNGGEAQPSYSEEEIAAKPWLALRMRRDVLPVHYDITMYPDFYDDAGEFYGNETIELNVLKPTRYFLIHIHTTYLNVTKSMLFDNATGDEIGVKSTFYYAQNEFHVVEAEREVSSAVKLKLQFEGSLTKAIVGIYKSTYTNTQTKQPSNLVSSKFEPTFARQAFPCFDEPNIKAEYTITLVHKPGYIALSNMPPDGPSTTYEHVPGLVKTKFQRSVKMSTYLVIFTVCDFLNVNTTSNRGVPIRVFATPDKINQTHYALDMAKHTLDFYEDLFAIDYPLPKLDLIAIPDFVSGAMEHWGLISFRESRLLYDPDQVSLSSKQTVAMVVAHEMAHQWFGNIVTMDWWNDLWLNEGFASYMEYVGVGSKEKDWDMEDMILTTDLFPVMKDDSQLSSHPIIVDVNNPSEITSVFDAISYYKGCSVIRMIEKIMGYDTFFRGVTTYLDRFKWGNAKTDDLWQALTEADSNRDVKHIMDTWTLQDGFPYVNITITTNAAGETTVTAAQKRFLASPKLTVDESASPLGYKWYISLDYTSSGGVNDTYVMDMNDATFTKNLSLSPNDGWVKFNHGQFGFYRVLYSEDMWEKFHQHLTQTPSMQWKLGVGDRAGLINDAFSLAQAGLTPYTVPLRLMEYLGMDREYLPWSSALSAGINYITEMLATDPDYGEWKRFLGARISTLMQNLGYVDEGSFLERRLRASILQLACETEDPSTVDMVSQQFRQWLDQNVSISVNLRSVVYKYGIIFAATDADWEKVWNKYLTEPSPQEKEMLIFALANTKKPHLIARLLDHAKRFDGIMRQDFFTVVSDVGNNVAAFGIVWGLGKGKLSTFY